MPKHGPDRQYTREDVLSAMHDRIEDGDEREPWTSTEMADELGCSRDVAYDRLRELHELGDIETKSIGSRGRIWWLV